MMMMKNKNLERTEFKTEISSLKQEQEKMLIPLFKKTFLTPVADHHLLVSTTTSLVNVILLLWFFCC